LLIVLFYVLFVRKCVLTPGVNPIAVNKYINKRVSFLESREVTAVPYLKA